MSSMTTCRDSHSFLVKPMRLSTFARHSSIALSRDLMRFCGDTPLPSIPSSSSVFAIGFLYLLWLLVFAVRTPDHILKFQFEGVAQFHHRGQFGPAMPAFDGTNPVRAHPAPFPKLVLREPGFEPRGFDSFTDYRVGVHCGGQ